MGGTFDPIHMGHLILGEKAYEQLELDKVLFMPCGNPPHKRNRKGRATDEQRAEMVRLAIEDNPHFELSLIEMHEEGYTYTYRTLEQLNKANPDTEYYFIIGADSLFNFDTWMEPERICQEAVLVVATRDHTPLKELDQQMQLLSQKYNGNFIRLDTMNIDVSSELLRSWHESGQSLRYYVPKPVISYIEKNDIYKGNLKICGILTEGLGSLESGNFERVIVGIGINCLKGSFPPELAGKAGSLTESDHPSFTRNQISTALIAELHRALNEQSHLDTSRYLEEYRKNCFIIGRNVTVSETGKEPYTAYVEGVDPEFRLQVKTPEEHRLLSGGEVSLKL